MSRHDAVIDLCCRRRLQRRPHGDAQSPAAARSFSSSARLRGTPHGSRSDCRRCRSRDGMAPPATPDFARRSGQRREPRVDPRSWWPAHRRCASRRAVSGINVRQTRCWNAVPRRSSGRSSACFGSSRNSSTARTARGQSRVVGNDLGARETLTEIAEQRLVRFGEANETDALVGRTDQQPAERTVGEGSADHLPCPAAPQRARGHAEQRAGLLIDAALRAVTRIGDRIGLRGRRPPRPCAGALRGHPRRSFEASARYGRGTCAGSGSASSRTGSPTHRGTGFPPPPR